MAITEVNRSPEKCSAVSTMERSMPDYDYTHLVRELRELMLAEIERDPKRFDQVDIDKVHKDEWFVARYLLRMKCDVKSSLQMLIKAMEFRNSPVINIRQFPEEFYKIGGIFHYEPDRKGNIPVYMRVKVHQKIPIVQEFLKSFLFNIIDEADKIAHGKGIALVFDMQGAGISNVDMDLLFFVITALVNYFPKGLSYMLVNELPWIMRSCWHISKQWLSEDHKDLVKFSDSRTIFEYIEEQNLPDFLGGCCKRDYRQVPAHAMTLEAAAAHWQLDVHELYKIRKKFSAHFLEEERSKQEQHQ